MRVSGLTSYCVLLGPNIEQASEFFEKGTPLLFTTVDVVSTDKASHQILLLSRLTRQ